ncbi:MAG: hypothetical protein UV76_C0017G0002 [Candidatus Nomurabacteria bacterium GW2011_GWA2_43_15]|uniref:Fibronectin type-III domain-containing protein n=1 Tax=Candidatus Nomurabacteria bacterium GW2011_GWA2_43_15 TaxID=1618738 RepID=A0A0G1DQH6_9BACT|nr:MAG: hypothetical protein UV76_C0017G0002 [Candidatus Nomurabacteria bacterium GW2011_GWA2_43_15]
MFQLATIIPPTGHGDLVSFTTLNRYTVSATAGSGGTISPASRTVDAGSTTTFTVTPSAGYKASASGCGGSPISSQTAAYTYTTGAITAACTVSATFAQMTGTLSASNCNISAGASSCNTSLSWTTTNPIGTSAVTTPTNITVGTGNNNSASYSVAYGSRTFYLYNNNILLAQATATASCTSGTAWNGSTCAQITGSCSASPNPQYVNSNVTWAASASGGTGTYTYSWSGTDGLSGTGSSVVKSYSTSGTKTGTVAITSGTGTISVNCNVVVQAITTYTLTINKAGTGSGTVTGAGTYNSGQTATATASASAGSIFTGWSGDCSGTNSSVSVLMDANKTCTATFVLMVVPTLTTSAVTGVTSNSVTSGGNVTSDGGATITARGFAVNSAINPTISNVKTTHTPESGTTGSFTDTLTYGFATNTTYHLRAYATNSAVLTGYGSDITFTTPPAVPTGLTATPSTCGTGTINVSWTASTGATSYKLYDNGSQIYSGSSTSYSHTGLTAGTSHSYTVSSSNGYSSPVSSAVAATAPAACAPTVTTTSPITNITQTTATGGGTVTYRVNSWHSLPCPRLRHEQ